MRYSLELPNKDRYELLAVHLERKDGVGVGGELTAQPEASDPEFKTLSKRRTRLLATATELYKCLDKNPPRENGEARPRTKISVKGQSAMMQTNVIEFSRIFPALLRHFRRSVANKQSTKCRDTAAMHELMTENGSNAQ